MTSSSSSYKNLNDYKNVFFLRLDAPHGHFEIAFKNVRVPVANLILGMYDVVSGRAIILLGYFVLWDMFVKTEF